MPQLNDNLLILAIVTLTIFTLSNLLSRIDRVNIVLKILQCLIIRSIWFIIFRLLLFEQMLHSLFLLFLFFDAMMRLLNLKVRLFKQNRRLNLLSACRFFVP